MANALVMILIALRYLDVGDLSATYIGRLFGMAMFVAHASSMAALLWLPIFLLILLWPQRHVVVPLAAAIGIVAVILLFADTVVYEQYRFHINSALLALFFSEASAATFEFSTMMKLQAGLLVVGIALGEWLLARLVWRFVVRSPGRSYGYALAAVLVAVFLGTNLVHAYADAAGKITLTRQTRLLPLYEPLTAKSFLADRGFAIVETPGSQVAAVGGSFAYPRTQLDAHSVASRPNILFIVVDSWRADAMTSEITPNVAEFAQDNIRFMQHFSGGNATRMGIFTLFYGIPGPYWHSALNTGTRAALVQRLDALDYQFGIFRSAPLNSPEFDRTVFAGMNNLRMQSEGKDSPARDIDANEDFLRFLHTRDPEQPFFGFLFFDSPHAYDLPEDAPMPFQPSWESVNYLALDEDTNPEPFLNLYKNSVHFVDSLIGQALAALRAQGLMDDTIIVITGDHGQEFNDTGQGYWGHNSNYTQYQTKVPLILHWPGRGAGRIDYFTSHFDVAATLMQRALGVENAFAATSVGHDLFTSGSRLPILMAKYRGYAAYTGERFLVFPPLGSVAVRDRHYRLIEEAAPGADVIREVLEQLGRFRAG